MIRKQQPDDDEPRHIPPVRPRDLLPDIDLSASDESYVIAQHTVEKRYSELLKAMYDATETSGAVPEVIPEDEYDGDLTIDAEAEAAGLFRHEACVRALYGGTHTQVNARKS